MSDSPYFLPPNSVLSCSGGRTSMYMLRKVLDAFGGELPNDRVAVFCNTGKEREETLEFVRDCAENWAVKIRWLEYRRPSPEERAYAVEVDFGTASREGEPFRQVILARKFLPNPTMRFCTGELKIRTTNRFVRRTLGWKRYFNAVGLRSDEPKRVAKILGRGRVKRRDRASLFSDADVPRRKRRKTRPAEPGESVALPLNAAGVKLRDVLDFWKAQPFDLRLPTDRNGRTLGGNCDLCFMKGGKQIADLIAADPGSADWWVEMEKLIARPRGAGTGKFRKDRADYAGLRRVALRQTPPPLWTEEDYGYGCDLGGCTD